MSNSSWFRVALVFAILLGVLIFLLPSGCSSETEQSYKARAARPEYNELRDHPEEYIGIVMTFAGPVGGIQQPAAPNVVLIDRPDILNDKPVFFPMVMGAVDDLIGVFWFGDVNFEEHSSMRIWCEGIGSCEVVESLRIPAVLAKYIGH